MEDTLINFETAKLTGQNKNDTNFKYLNKNEIKI